MASPSLLRVYAHEGRCTPAAVCGLSEARHVYAICQVSAIHRKVDCAILAGNDCDTFLLAMHHTPRV